MSDAKTETRIVLRGRHTAELVTAQEFDRQAAYHDDVAAKARTEAAACRHRAGHLKIAAERLAADDAVTKP